MVSAKLAENMRKRWADPEWAAKQRKRIAEGMHASPHVGDAQRERWRKIAAGEQEECKRQPWKPGDPKPEWLRRAG